VDGAVRRAVLGAHRRQGAWALPTAYAVFFLVRELAFPLSTSACRGHELRAATSHAYRAAEVITFLAALTLLTWVRAGHGPLAAVFAAVFGVSALTTAVGNAATLTGHDPHPTAADPSDGSSGTDKPDVYQILFDEYQTVEHRFARKLKGVALRRLHLLHRQRLQLQLDAVVSAEPVDRQRLHAGSGHHRRQVSARSTRES
jgi:hypothetical protein